MLNAPSAFVIEPFFGVFAEEFTFLLAVRLAGRLDFDLVDLPLSFAIVRAASCYIGRRTGSRLLFFTCGRRSTSRRGVRRGVGVGVLVPFTCLLIKYGPPYWTYVSPSCTRLLDTSSLTVHTLSSYTQTWELPDTRWLDP